VEILGTLSRDVKAIALLPAAFHPPTRAHEALLRAALAHCDAVIAVLARQLPHKEYGAVGLEQRLEMVRPMLGDNMAAAVSAGGLFHEIAREAREHFSEASVHLVCGRDAAERILGWQYEGHPAIEEQLREFRLLVAARGGEFTAPDALRERVAALALDGEFDAVSSTEVRERMAAGEPWEHLVPSASTELVRRYYSPLVFSRNARNL
jgi:nicotinate-nucleotide adenylyltransferase